MKLEYQPFKLKGKPYAADWHFVPISRFADGFQCHNCDTLRYAGHPESGCPCTESRITFTGSLVSDPAPNKLANKLAQKGVFKGFHGLEGLRDSQEFWDSQPYGTRLYYGGGIADYLHRSVLRTAIEILNAEA